MKKFTLPPGGFILTTLALMLLLIVTACENDDEPTSFFKDPVLIFHTMDEIRVAVGETLIIQPTLPPGLVAHPEVTWSWKILNAPEASQASLTNGDQPNANFRAGLPGIYELELTAKLGIQKHSDIVLLKVFNGIELEGDYQVLFETDGAITGLFKVQNNLYATGIFSNIGGVAANGIASYDGTNWRPMGSGIKWDETLYPSIDDMIEFQGDLYVAGHFAELGGVTSPAIARWDGIDWKAVPGLEVSIVADGWSGYYLTNRGTSLKVFQNQLYVGGHFEGENLGAFHAYSVLQWDGNKLTGKTSLINSAEDLEIHKEQLLAFGYDNLTVASFDGSEWRGLDFPVNHELSYNINFSHGINLFSFKEQLFINTRTWISDNPDQAHLVSDIFKWDDLQLQQVFSPDNTMYTFEVIGDLLYAGGDKGMVTWDGQQWGVVKDGPEVSINAIQPFQDQLFVAGSFEGKSTNSIAVWKGK
jgi:hypothetical protein